MAYLGDYKAGQTVYCKWGSSGADGASITRATNGSILIYKNGSDTERSSSAGITDTEDFDSKTGLHHIGIDLSNNTDSGFYAAGNDYDIVLSGAVIDGKTVNVPLHCFSIQNRYPHNATFAELTAIPTFPMSMIDMIKLIYELSAHLKVQNADGTFSLTKADGTTVLAEAVASDDGTELSFGALAAP